MKPLRTHDCAITALLFDHVYSDTPDALVRLDEGVAVLEASASSPSLELIATDLFIFQTVRDALDALMPLSAAATPTRAARRMAALHSRARTATDTDTLRATMLQQFRAHAPAVTALTATGAREAAPTLRTVYGVGAALGDDVRAELVGAHVATRVSAFRAAFIGR